MKAYYTFENLIICHTPSFILSTLQSPYTVSFSSQGATAVFLLTFSILFQKGRQRCFTEKKLRALSIQQKFRFEIPEIFRVQWNGTVRFHRPDPSYRALGYCSCKQDTKERYWGQQLCQMERNISVRPTEMTRPVKEDHLQSWSRIFRSDQTEMVRSI